MRLDDSIAASDLLWETWQRRGRLAALPPDIRPQTRLEGYVIQSHLMRRSALGLYGWKIAATSIAGQKHIGVDGPMAGRILGERVLPSGSTIALAGNLMKVAEVEFAFRFGADLPPKNEPYSEGEVMAAVASLHPSIEVPDSRYSDFVHVGAPQLIADNSCADWLLVGDAAPAAWRDLDLAAYRPVGRIAGKGEWTGLGANVLGGPVIALVWLVNELSARGITLKAGETVTTGTCLTPLAVEPGAHVIADFWALGVLVVRFS